MSAKHPSSSLPRIFRPNRFAGMEVMRRTVSQMPPEEFPPAMRKNSGMVPYARGWGWSAPRGPYGARSDASDPGATHGIERILRMFSSLIEKKNAPVRAPSASTKSQAVSAGDFPSAFAASPRVLPDHGRVSPLHPPPIIMSSRSSRAAAVSSTILARSTGSRRRSSSATAPPACAQSGSTKSSSVPAAQKGYLSEPRIRPASTAFCSFSSTASILPQLRRPAVFKCDISVRTPVAAARSRTSSIASSMRSPSLRMCVV